MNKVIIAIIGFIIIGGIYAYANYDIKVDEQKFEQMLPLKMVEQKFDELYETIPTESIESTLQEFSDSIPIKIEEKTLTLEDRLMDCSKYKREYLESYKNVKTTDDSMSAMIGDSLAGVQKTRACEKYNAEIKKQYEVDPERELRIQAEHERVALARVEQEAANKAAEEERQIAIQKGKEYAENTPMRCQDLTQKDFSGCDLRNFTMHDMDFSYANFQGANLFAVDLSRTNFTSANLDGAFFGRADISGAIFTGCTGIPTGQTAGATLPICTLIP